MPVTLRLAQISTVRLAACRRSADELHRLCSFEYEPESAYLDLDWAPDGLLRMCLRTGIGDVAALRLAMDGEEEVNPAYREWPYGVMEPPRAVEPAGVIAVAAALSGIELPRIFVAMPVDPQEAAAAIGGCVAALDGDPRRYLAAHFNSLREFYQVAADGRLAVVVWCD